MTVNLQGRRADDLATSDKFGLQVLPFAWQLLIGPDVKMSHVPLQLEFKRLKLIGKGCLLWVSEFNPDEHSSTRQVDPVIDASRRNLGPFDNLPHLVHEPQSDFAVPFVLYSAAETVKVKPNWCFDDLDVHQDLLGLR